VGVELVDYGGEPRTKEIAGFRVKDVVGNLRYVGNLFYKNNIVTHNTPKKLSGLSKFSGTIKEISITEKRSFAISCSGKVCRQIQITVKKLVWCPQIYRDLDFRKNQTVSIYIRSSRCFFNIRPISRVSMNYVFVSPVNGFCNVPFSQTVFCFLHSFIATQANKSLTTSITGIERKA
jgi:hypothetical protein